MGSPRTPSTMPDPATSDARLDALDAAAVGLLEPLIGVMPLDSGLHDAGTWHAGAALDWRVGLASALDRLAQAARALELLGLAQAVALLASHLRDVSKVGAGDAPREPSADALADIDGPLEMALAEAWVGDAIAFCSGQLAADESTSLIGRLRDWRGLSARVTPAVVEPIAARLRQDAQRIAAATLADLRTPTVRDDEEAAPDTTDAALPIGADELQMLAEAAGQLDEEFLEAFHGPAQSAGESLESVADAIERYANAIAYVGLAPVSEVLFALHRNLSAFAHDPAGFEAKHRALLDRLPPLWSRLFEAPSEAAARQALMPIADAAWPIAVDPAMVEAARRAFGAIVAVGSRRVAFADDEVGEQDMSLAIPEDADRDVVDNLLRELPTLSAMFSESIEAVQAGSPEAIVAAQRIAHTLKGSANTVGVRGIAVLTHQLEDLLQLLESIDAPLAAPLVHALSDAADCLAEMSEAVAGLGAPPANALEIHREVRAWTHRVLGDPGAAIAVETAHDREGPAAPEPAVAPMREPAVEPTSERAAAADAPGGPVAAPGETAAAPAEAEAAPGEHALASGEHAVASGEPAAAPGEPAAASNEPAAAPTAGRPVAAPGEHAPTDEAPAQEWLRVPASLIERLLAFANEASILLSQAQERASEVDRVRTTLSSGTDQLQDLAAELERLVDVRGLALSDRRERDDFDPLELDEHNDLQMVSRRIAESGADGRLIEQQLGRNLSALRDSLSQLERLQVDLREAALQTRTVHVDTVVPRWRRTVRQAARMAGREVELQVDGDDTEIDAQLLQSLVEPVGHLLRNAVDHGIEPPAERQRVGKAPSGRIRLALRREGPDLLVDCSDDGAGLDLSAIRARALALRLIETDEAIDDERLTRLVLHSGFSTRDRATQLSGRGIGLDVVDQMVREQRGSIDIETRRAAGTRVRLRIPVRMAALPVILVRSPSQVLALSVRDVEQIVATDRLVDDAHGERRLLDGDRLWRVVRLEDALGLPEDAFAPPPGVETAAPVVLQVRMTDGERVALVVPEPGQPRNVVLRPLASFLPPIPGLEGATVLGDGAVAPVYDLPRLLSARDGARAAPALRDTLPATPVCLVVDDSVSVRRTMEQFVRDLGYEVDSAADGIEALECVRRRIPALVLVDLEMPRMNGVEFVRALRADPASRAVPVIMITSRSSDKHRALALGAGVDVFLTKPYTEDALASLIAQRVRTHAGDR